MRGISMMPVVKPMSLSFDGSDIPSVRDSWPSPRKLLNLSRSRAKRPAQAKGLPHQAMSKFEKTKWHWLSTGAQLAELAHMAEALRF